MLLYTLFLESLYIRGFEHFHRRRSWGSKFDGEGFGVLWGSMSKAKVLGVPIGHTFSLRMKRERKQRKRGLRLRWKGLSIWNVSGSQRISGLKLRGRIARIAVRAARIFARAVRRCRRRFVGLNPANGGWIARGARARRRRPTGSVAKRPNLQVALCAPLKVNGRAFGNTSFLSRAFSFRPIHMGNRYYKHSAS